MFPLYFLLLFVLRVLYFVCIPFPFFFSPYFCSAKIGGGLKIIWILCVFYTKQNTHFAVLCFALFVFHLFIFYDETNWIYFT